MAQPLKQVTPNLAELLQLLPECTNDDIDELLKFLKLLHRGRGVAMGSAVGGHVGAGGKTSGWGGASAGLDYRDRSPRRDESKSSGGLGGKGRFVLFWGGEQLSEQDLRAGVQDLLRSIFPRSSGDHTISWFGPE